jgi:hypothetical protein
MDRDNRVLPVHLAGEHRPDLGGLDVAFVGFKRLAEVGFDVLALTSPVDEDGEVVGLPAERPGQGPLVFEPPSALQDLLRGRLILPEVARGDLFLDFGQVALETSFVKAPSGGWWRAR